MEDMSVFKSYLRRLLQDLKDLKEAIKNGEYEKAEQMADRLIDDTQKGIEDNEKKSRKAQGSREGGLATAPPHKKNSIF